MKLALLALGTILFFIECKDDKSQSKTNTSVDESIPKQNIIDYEQGVTDTIIPTSEIQKIIASLDKSSMSKTQIQYLKLALRKAHSFDEIEQEAINYNKSFFEKRKDSLQKKYRDSTTEISLYHAWQNDELLNANDAIHNFQDHDNPVKLALQSAGAGSPEEYLKSIYFDVSNAALQNIVTLSRVTTGSGPIINGLRIYIGKDDADVNTKNYKLIIVATKDDKDIFYPNTGPLLSIQNYGQPCRPNCTGKERLPF